MRIIYTKLFINPKEGEMYLPSVVSYAKIPWVVTKDNGIIQYKYFLYINLWLIAFEFYWKGKLSNLVTE